ncbi:MAG: peptidoglycan DD-metalloendopeptidase family protein [Leptospiraceae bacterium]|nr:peptidoglycan DD-metalloendopeptidase family protein [Leptospiraceae bacterium]MCP5510596.1 peptidoglycan DD-metalloendopeptidase family protein [Leptospiraceae bacterium]
MLTFHPDLTFYERMVLRLRRLENWITRIHNQGKTKISILLIPHSNEKIIKLDLSVYLILFLFSLSAILSSLSIYYVSAHFLKKKNIYSILDRGNQQNVVFLHHHEKAEELEESIKELSLMIESLNTVTWGKYSQQTQLHPIESSRGHSIFQIFSDREEMKSNRKIFKETVDKFNALHNRLSELKPIFLNSSDYLETRESIVQSMPRGRPLGPGVGFVASTFGKREDPVFGGGEFHNGVDFAAPMRTPIYATAPGIIADAISSNENFGNHIRINHENGFFTLYAHCSELRVKKGDRVNRGALIALVGSTGKSTGSHLHYEVHIGMDPAYNPQEFINID